MSDSKRHLDWETASTLVWAPSYHVSDAEWTVAECPLGWQIDLVFDSGESREFATSTSLLSAMLIAEELDEKAVKDELVAEWRSAAV